ncbi:MAG: hypothetical protein IJ809_06795 [Clostridia bacterium]|nr:hypothetical protein [Clostridia bacterium]
MISENNSKLCDSFGKIEITNAATTNTSKRRTLVIEGTGVKIVLRTGFDKEYLRNVVEVLCS